MKFKRKKLLLSSIISVTLLLNCAGTVNASIVKPHDLASHWFKGSFKPSCIHKITRY